MIRKKRKQQELEAKMIDNLCMVLGKFLDMEKKKLELKCLEAAEGKKKND